MDVRKSSNSLHSSTPLSLHDNFVSTSIHITEFQFTSYESDITGTLQESIHESDA